MAGAFHGERKTDAHDAYVIAQTLRMRADLPTLTVADGVQRPGCQAQVAEHEHALDPVRRGQIGRAHV